MHIDKLNLSSFRCCNQLEMSPGEGLNIIRGENAQGKTSILEALWLLTTTRSLRAYRESEMIERGQENAHITASVVREKMGEIEIQVSIHLSDRKTLKVNGSKRGRMVDLIGELNAVFFGSPDMAIVAGEPSDRRHFMNIEIAQISPKYIHTFASYKKVLEQRNKLLRDLRDNPRGASHSGLDAWTEQLIIHGGLLFERRQFYLDRLAPIADRIHQELTDGKECLEIRYLPSIHFEEVNETSDEYPEGLMEERAPFITDGSAREISLFTSAFREQIRKIEPDEIRRGTTLIGPQRDDIQILINGKEARLYGSQGQQRTAALALKLAEFKLIELCVGEAPIMLLDDVMSDLDDARRMHLLRHASSCGQTFLTCTAIRSIPKEMLEQANLWNMSNGEISEGSCE